MAWRDVELSLFLTAFRFWPSLGVAACWISALLNHGIYGK
jgi:hypothetical protein